MQLLSGVRRLGRPPHKRLANVRAQQPAYQTIKHIVKDVAGRCLPQPEREQLLEGSLRVFAISDLHTHHRENMEWLQQLSLTAFRGDVVLVAGDISHELEELRLTLTALQQRFALVFFCPGNHELWVKGQRRHAPAAPTHPPTAQSPPAGAPAGPHRIHTAAQQQQEEKELAVVTPPPATSSLTQPDPYTAPAGDREAFWARVLGCAANGQHNHFHHHEHHNHELQYQQQEQHLQNLQLHQQHEHPHQHQHPHPHNHHRHQQQQPQEVHGGAVGGCQGGDSVGKLAAVLGLCEDLGVVVRPARVGRLRLVPLLSWHHKAFDTEPDIPAIPRANALTISDYARCMWPERIREEVQRDAGPGAVREEEGKEKGKQEAAAEMQQQEGKQAAGGGYDASAAVAVAVAVRHPVKDATEATRGPSSSVAVVGGGNDVGLVGSIKSDCRSKASSVSGSSSSSRGDNGSKTLPGGVLDWGSGGHGSCAVAAWFDMLNDRLWGELGSAECEECSSSSSSSSSRSNGGIEDYGSSGGSNDGGGGGGDDVISFSHFLPLQALLPEKRYLTFPNLAKAVGSTYLGRRVRALRPHLHVFGHTHFGWDMELEGIRYLQAPLAYPSERRLRLRSLTMAPLTTTATTTAISPPNVPHASEAGWLPLCVYEASYRLRVRERGAGSTSSSAVGGGGGVEVPVGDPSEVCRQLLRAGWRERGGLKATGVRGVRGKGASAAAAADDDGSPATATATATGGCGGDDVEVEVVDWSGRWCPPQMAMWSAHYQRHPRTPSELQLAPWVAQRYGRRLKHQQTAAVAVADKTAVSTTMAPPSPLPQQQQQQEEEEEEETAVGTEEE